MRHRKKNPQNAPLIVQTPDKTGYADIWHISWPQILMMGGHFLLGFVEVAVAGRLGEHVQAAVGMMTQCLFFFMIITVALGSGVVATLSQSLGMGLKDRAQRYIWLSLEAGLALSLAIMLAGLLCKDYLLGALNVPEDAMPVARTFIWIYLLLLPAHTILFIGSAIFRSHRKVFIPLYAMIIVTAVGIGCIFILGPGFWIFKGFGAEGLAWATFISVHCGAVFIIIFLRRAGLLNTKLLPTRHWIKNAWQYIFKVSWPSGMSQLLWQGGFLVLFAITASLPNDKLIAVAGMSAGQRIEAILFLPAIAFSMTASVIVGELLGAGKPEAAKSAGWRVLGLGCACISTCAAILWIFTEPASALSTDSEPVQGQVISYLRYNLLANPFVIISMIMSGIMTGAGATTYSLVTFGLATWVIRLPLAWLLGHMIYESSQGVFMAMLISQIIQALIMLYLFQYSPWQRFSMRSKRHLKVNSLENKLEETNFKT